MIAYTLNVLGRKLRLRMDEYTNRDRIDQTNADGRRQSFARPLVELDAGQGRYSIDPTADDPRVALGEAAEPARPRLAYAVRSADPRKLADHGVDILQCRSASTALWWPPH